MLLNILIKNKNYERFQNIFRGGGVRKITKVFLFGGGGSEPIFDILTTGM